MRKSRFYEDESPQIETIKPRAAVVTITIQTGENKVTHAYEIPDFKGSVPGPKFIPKTIHDPLKETLITLFGKANELP